MKLLETIKILWYSWRHRNVIYVKTQEEADAINGYLALPDDVILNNIKLIEPSYGRLVTFEFDTSSPEGKQIFEYIKVVAQLNAKSYADLKVGDNYVTFDFVRSEDAEELRAPWIKLAKAIEEADAAKG